MHGGITYETEGVTASGAPGRATASVGDEIEELHRKIDQLVARVAALGG